METGVEGRAEERGTIALARATRPDDAPAARRRSLEHWLVFAGSWIGLAGLVALGLLLEPDPRGYGTHEQLGFLPCLPMVLWRFPCPGCGVTTALVHATHGELASALRTQPFGLLLALATPLLAFGATLAHLRGRDLGRELERLRAGRLALAGVGLLVVCWAYKIAAVRGWLQL